MSEWINCEDQLPQKNQQVWVKIKGSLKKRLATFYPRRYPDGFLQSMGFAWAFDDVKRDSKWPTITHWKPIPFRGKKRGI